MNSSEYTIMGCILTNSIKKYLSIDVTFICLYCNLSQENIQLLKKYYDIVQEVQKIEFQTFKQNNQFKELYTWVDSCFTKFHIFELTQFKKVLFTDVDMLCFGDLSQIFDIETPAGVLVSKYKEGYQSGIPITKQLLYDALISGYGISASFFLIQPQKGDYEKIIQICQNISSKRRYLSIYSTDLDQNYRKQFFNAGPDEQVLAYFYWNKTKYCTQWNNISRQYSCVSWLKYKFETGGFREKPLSYQYYKDIFYSDENCQQIQLQDKINEFNKIQTEQQLKYDYQQDQNKFQKGLRKIYIIHYVTGKPWQKDKKTNKIWPDCRMWFDFIQTCDQTIQTKSKQLFGDWNQYDYMTQQQADDIYDSTQKALQIKLNRKQHNFK